MSDKLPPEILVIEPDELLNASLCNSIERYWFNVTRARSADAAVRSTTVSPPHIAIISSRLQDISSVEMAAQLRKIQGLNELPVLFLLEEDESKSNSVDDYTSYLSRPFTPNELMTTIRALLRKSRPVFQDKVLKYSDISMDLCTYKIQRGSKQVHLGPTEFKILQLLIQKPSNIYSRRQIIDYVWGTEKEISDRTIDVHINRIRGLMKLDTDKYPIIKTIRAAGYCLD
ncbi:MAG: winged helix-turn-helix domain-containing protein [Rickettsiaceae bacterium]|nr:winged helix-turn-helix domain-containing protein [Rickettsiaceae bacterium]